MSWGFVERRSSGCRTRLDSGSNLSQRAWRNAFQRRSSPFTLHDPLMTTFPKTSTASSPDVKGDDCAHRGQAPIFILIKEDGCHCHSMERMRHYRRSRHIDAAPPSFHETIAPISFSFEENGSHQHNYESVPLSHLGNPREIRRLRASS